MRYSIWSKVINLNDGMVKNRQMTGLGELRETERREMEREGSVG